MTKTLLISSMAHRRIGRAAAWLEQWAPADEVLIIGANPDAANELARKVVQTRGAAFGYHRLSLTQFGATLAATRMAARGLVPLGRLGVLAITARVVHELAAKNALGRFANIALSPGFAKAVVGVLIELRLAKPDLTALDTVAPEVLSLLQAYESQLAEAGLGDWADVLTFATEVIISGDVKQRLTDLPILLLDAPVASRAELDFIRSASLRTRDFLATAPTADERTVAHLRDELGLDVVDLDALSNTESDPGTSSIGSLSSLQRHLFNESSTTGVAQPNGEVLVFSAPGESRECVEIARRMVALARDGIAFDQMAVLLRSPEQYRAHLEEAFSRAGIPAHFARGAVRPDPAGRAFYSLLRCAAEGLSARRFAEYLSLSQVPVATSDGTPPEASPREERWVPPDQELVSRPMAKALTEAAALTANPNPAETANDTITPVIGGQLRAPHRWERLIIEAAVIGGRERWHRRIEGLANQLRLHILELRQENEARATVLGRTLEDLEVFAGYALPLIDALDELPRLATWGEWLDKLSALATRAISQPSRVLSVLSELSPMSSVGPVTLAEVLLVLSDLLLEVGVPPPAHRYGSVFVGPVEAARGLTFVAVFVPGLAEKLFPHKIVEEPLLLDAAREQLEAGLMTNEERLARERLALIVAAGAAERQICFSYPRLDLEQGRPRVPSFYALEALRASEGRLPDFSELSRRAETATSARVGWPAPPDPTAAIDDAEYDLAVLDRLFTRSQGDAGSARFLISGNPYLARALRARWQRWSRRWTPADGWSHHPISCARSWPNTSSPLVPTRQPRSSITQAVHTSSFYRPSMVWRPGRCVRRSMSWTLSSVDHLCTTFNLNCLRSCGRGDCYRSGSRL
jgi:hypothetical protein